MSTGTESMGSSCESGSGTSNQDDDNNAPLWRYVTKVGKIGGGGNTKFQCNYCQTIFSGSFSSQGSSIENFRSWD